MVIKIGKINQNILGTHKKKTNIYFCLIFGLANVIKDY